MHRKSPCGSKVKECCQAIMSLALPRSLHFKIHLGWGVFAYSGKGPSIGQVWKKKADNWPEGRQRHGRTALYKWLNCLFTVLHTRAMPTALLSGCASLPCFCLSWTSCFSVCFPTCCCAMSHNKLCTCTYSFCLCDKCIFTEGKDPGETSF